MASNEIPQRLLVAIGGNATHPVDIRGTTEEQSSVAAAAAGALLPLVLACPELVLTHGNGPVVGKILMRQFHARDVVPPMRLDVCVADSQGGIGYLLTQAIENALILAGRARPVTCVLTEVEVDPDDPGFAAPSKPIGPFFSEDKARALIADGWPMMEDAGRGWRVAVPSPLPKAIVSLASVEAALRARHVVIAAGGGGIPVVRAPDGTRRGMPAVIDKDLTSALLARALGIDELLILTTVPRVAIRYRQPGEQWLETVRASRLRGYLDEGHFARGSMAPKVDAALRFLADGGRRVIIAQLTDGAAALRGETGTHILPD